MKNRPKKIPKGLKRSQELSRSFSCFNASDMHAYLSSIGFSRKPGQWAWHRGKDRAYVVNPEYGLLFVDIYTEEGT
jgi:hypothetical protein